MTSVNDNRRAKDLPDGSLNLNPVGVSFWALVREDFAANERQWLHQGFWTLFWHRFGNWRMSVRTKLLRLPLTLIYRFMFKCCEWMCGMSLPYNVPVGRRVRLEHFGGMVLIARSIGNDVTIRQNTTFGITGTDDLAAHPVIEDAVDIGVGAVVLGAVTLGTGSIIGANAVVTKDIPPRSVAAGVPAKVIRTLDEAQE